jgi:catechol 2,3-dioxygenase-like lactoylglutathione lyase family enzyme
MLTRIDHVLIAVPDLERGVQAYRRLGFDVRPGGVHAGLGTHNAIAFFEGDYLELLAVRDPAEHRAAVAGAGPGHPLSGLGPLLAAGGGLRAIVLQSDDLAADVAAMRARGVQVSDPIAGERRTPAGATLRWTMAFLGGADPPPLVLVQHLSPLAERRPAPGSAGHPNGTLGLDRAYVVVPELAAVADGYARVLGLPVPPRQRGTVIQAEMVVFPLGPTGLGIARPAAPGPAAEALARQGPGPFQVLYRARSMDAAARAVAAGGLPPPLRGVRNTGEQAMLVPPEHACGVYVGFAGPA